jgi:hypothetical protein
MNFGMRLIAVAAVPACVLGCGQIGFWQDAPVQPAVVPVAITAAQVGPGQQPAPAAAPQGSGRLDYMGQTAVADGEGAEDRGTVARALDYADKWAKSQEECRSLRQGQEGLAAENKRLLAQVARLEMQLEQSKKELDEANEMLLEMGNQLREWKGNVLGFRKEIQDYFQVVMDSQKKVLNVLNGDVAEPKPPAPAKSEVSVKDASR